MKKEKKCLKCGYEWKSVIDPKSCPNCKRYDWKIPRGDSDE